MLTAATCREDCSVAAVSLVGKAGIAKASGADDESKGIFTFSGNGMGFIVGFFSSSVSSTFVRLEAEGEEGSSSALRLPSRN